MTFDKIEITQLVGDFGHNQARNFPAVARFFNRCKDEFGPGELLDFTKHLLLSRGYDVA